jgi:hypothetical protein
MRCPFFDFFDLLEEFVNPFIPGQTSFPGKPPFKFSSRIEFFYIIHRPIIIT